MERKEPSVVLGLDVLVFGCNTELPIACKLATTFKMAIFIK